MHRVRVNLHTKSEVERFVEIARAIPDEVCLEDNNRHRVDAKSLLGCLYSVEFDEIYVTSDNPMISNKFKEFMF